MVNEFDKRRLRFLVAPVRNYNPKLKEDMEKAYLTWKAVWSKAFPELKEHEYMHSDHYTRKTHVAILFHGDNVVGLATSNVLDLSLQQDLDDSYFKLWPETTMTGLRTDARTVMTCCNATLNFDYRKNKLGTPALEIIFGLLVMYMKSTNIDAMLGTPRLEKEVEKYCYRTGAIPLAKKVPYTVPGRFIDLVCWNRNLNLKDWDPELLEIISYIWNKNSRVEEIKTGERYAA